MVRRVSERSQMIRALIVLIAAAAAILPVPPSLVESIYSRGLYPHVQHLLTPVSNRAPFAIFDALVIAGVLAVVTMLVRAARAARRMRHLRPIGHTLGRLVAAGAVVYLAFLILWGFNYRRVPIEARLVTGVSQPGAAAVKVLSLRAASEVNTLHAPAHAGGWDEPGWRDMALRDAFARTQGLLGLQSRAVPGRLKWTIFGPYFRWTGVDGMVDPFALEVLANPDLLPWERPFVAAHEWAHLAGFADESEANFVGWLTCVRGDAGARYSGWMFLLWETSADLDPAVRAAVLDTLGRGPREDMTAIAERLRRGQVPMLRLASWRVYDEYLKANRVDTGVRSYGAVVSLILRARFDEGWVPRLRQDAVVTRD